MSYERRTSAGWATHPGDILKHEFLKPMGISGYALAKAIGVTAQRVSDITTKKSGISADMAMLLGAFFGTSAEFWMNLHRMRWAASARKSGTKSKRSNLTPMQPETDAPH